LLLLNKAHDISSPLENQLVLKSGYQNCLPVPSRVVEVVATVVIIVDD
jgi:hypothetical protein